MPAIINSADRTYGKVKFFNRQPDKTYGFACVQGSSLEVFFHLNARLSFDEDTHYPEKGNWISFEMISGRMGVKAVAWRLEPNYIPPAIVSGIRQHFDISELPRIGSEQIEERDEVVDSVGHLNGVYRVEWFDIVYRPRTHELFKILCWDSENSSYQPDLEVTTLADVTFGKMSTVKSA